MPGKRLKPGDDIRVKATGHEGRVSTAEPNDEGQWGIMFPNPSGGIGMFVWMDRDKIEPVEEGDEDGDVGRLRDV